MDKNNQTIWVFYDGQCRVCIGLTKKLMRILPVDKFEFAPLQLPWVQKTVGLDGVGPLQEMKVLTQSGFVLGGIDAVIYLAKQTWWGQPFYLLTRLPVLKKLFGKLYVFTARRRYCVSGQCQLTEISQSQTVREL